MGVHVNRCAIMIVGCSVAAIIRISRIKNRLNKPNSHYGATAG
jgi:hypothetical protein